MGYFLKIKEDLHLQKIVLVFKWNTQFVIFLFQHYSCLLDFNECERKTSNCHFRASCVNERGSYSCKCKPGYVGNGRNCVKRKPRSCSEIRKHFSSSGNYVIDPDGEGGLAPFAVYCDMTGKKGVGVTVISHDSESRMYVQGCETGGCYSRDIHYTGTSLSQLASLTVVSSHCEQFIKYECYHSRIFVDGGFAWWVSRDSTKMTYWGGASRNGKCACGMTTSCANPSVGCNCDKNDSVWREDSGFLTDKTKLPVKQLRFGDTGGSGEKGYHTLGKLKCYGVV